MAARLCVSVSAVSLLQPVGINVGQQTLSIDAAHFVCTLVGVIERASTSKWVAYVLHLCMCVFVRACCRRFVIV